MLSQGPVSLSSPLPSCSRLPNSEGLSGPCCPPASRHNKYRSSRPSSNQGATASPRGARAGRWQRGRKPDQALYVPRVLRCQEDCAPPTTPKLEEHEPASGHLVEPGDIGAGDSIADQEQPVLVSQAVEDQKDPSQNVEPEPLSEPVCAELPEPETLLETGNQLEAATQSGAGLQLDSEEGNGSDQEKSPAAEEEEEEGPGSEDDYNDLLQEVRRLLSLENGGWMWSQCGGSGMYLLSSLGVGY